VRQTFKFNSCLLPFAWLSTCAKHLAYALLAKQSSAVKATYFSCWEGGCRWWRILLRKRSLGRLGDNRCGTERACDFRHEACLRHIDEHRCVQYSSRVCHWALVNAHILQSDVGEVEVTCVQSIRPELTLIADYYYQAVLLFE